MYGLVNKAVKDLISTQFGQKKWEAICIEAGIKDVEFSSMQNYPDQMTYALVGAASKILELSPEEILKAFGRYWTLFTAHEGYGEIMDMFGANFVDAIKNLNHLHSRMGLTMPELRPPRFEFLELSDSNWILEYHSEREGLAPMMIGLLEGLAEKYQFSVKIDHIPKSEAQNFDKFEIKKVTS